MALAATTKNDDLGRFVTDLAGFVTDWLCCGKGLVEPVAAVQRRFFKANITVLLSLSIRTNQHISP
jgi:hypothetical protein